MIWLRIIAALWKPLAALLAVLGVYGKGRADARQKAKQRDLEAYRETRERMDAAPRHTDADAWRRWLRERDE